MDSINWTEDICNFNIGNYIFFQFYSDNLTIEETKINKDNVEIHNSMLIKIRNYLAKYQEQRGLLQDLFEFDQTHELIYRTMFACPFLHDYKHSACF